MIRMIATFATTISPKPLMTLARGVSASPSTIQTRLYLGHTPIFPPNDGSRLVVHGTTRSDASSIMREGTQCPLFVAGLKNSYDPSAFDTAKAYALIASKAVQNRNLGSLADPVLVVVKLGNTPLAVHDQFGTSYILPGTKIQIHAILDANTLKPTTIPPDGEPLRRPGSTALNTSVRYYGTLMGALGGFELVSESLPALVRYFGVS